jgi:hypothetical protein
VKSGAKLVGLEAALSVHTAESQHPVNRGLSRCVTLGEFLGRIAGSFPLKALSLAPSSSQPSFPSSW